MRTFRTPLGLVSVTATARGLARVILPEGKRCQEPFSCKALFTGSERKRFLTPFSVAEAIASRAQREIREYLAGRRRRFTVPLDLSGLSPFHRRVLRAARRIPFGCTATYRDLARRAGSPLAARAVGRAMARNPVPLVIPCHRVVAAGGGLGGYGGGLALKRRLLVLEGARSLRGKVFMSTITRDR